ncbi:alpha/beta hydrolase [Actinopolyspora mortivallis]|uniref:alpha/beta hydrolase n=1 Tax=Actinopolyspora mortivallis TaxID=33906 RepID=UPI00035CB6C0|nr:alpha/beta family hydrolase [Actinopolyspora mortivallis]
MAVLVLHGGRPRSEEPMRPWRLAYLRMGWLARTLRTAVNTAPRPAGVWLLRNRLRGWNEPLRDPLVDARWATAAIRARQPDTRIVLVGHSMGGRAALLLGDEPGVDGVCALAPWVESSDPYEHLGDTEVLLVHGDRDRTTSARASADYARRAAQSGHRVRFRRVPGGGHAMLRHHREWANLVREFVVRAVDEAGSRQGAEHTPESPPSAPHSPESPEDDTRPRTG